MSKKIPKKLTKRELYRKHLIQVKEKSAKAKKKLSIIHKQQKALNKKASKLEKIANSSKFIGKFVIFNHIDHDGRYCYYANTVNNDEILTEGDSCPTTDGLMSGPFTHSQLFTKKEVVTFINKSLRYLAKRDYPSSTLYWVKRRLYGSVMPFSEAFKLSKYCCPTF